MRSLGWALIPCDRYKKRHIKGRLGEYNREKMTIYLPRREVLEETKLADTLNSDVQTL